MYRFTKTWKTVRPGDRYESDCFQGEVCPDNLLDAAVEAGVVEDFPDAVEEAGDSDTWSKEEVMACRKKAPLVELLKSDPEHEVEGVDDMKLPDLKAAAIAIYFA